jgi:hypothetical protein
MRREILSVVDLIHLLLMSTFKNFGLIGCGSVIIATLFSALRYRGKENEPYSVLNHFISELGEVGVSPHASVFNRGLIIGGVLLLPFIIGLGVYLGNLWAIIGIFAGIWTASSCILVGLFPMNQIAPHLRAAISYFRAGLVMVLLFTFAILAQPADHTLVPKTADIFGIFSILAYATFLFLLRKTSVSDQAASDLDTSAVRIRPRFWLTAAIEWLVLVSTILWFFSIALYI